MEEGFLSRHQNAIGFSLLALFRCFLVTGQEGHIDHPVSSNLLTVLVEIDDIAVRQGVAKHAKNLAGLAILDGVRIIGKWMPSFLIVPAMHFINGIDDARLPPCSYVRRRLPERRLKEFGFFERLEAFHQIDVALSINQDMRCPHTFVGNCKDRRCRQQTERAEQIVLARRFFQQFDQL